MTTFTQERSFVVMDYVVFGGMLSISALIGIYYAVRDRNLKDGTKGYLLANKSMGVLPVAMSMTVSFQSSVLILGYPSDIYLYGTYISWKALSLIAVSLITCELFVPTFYRLEISSIYEYLERRFNKVLRVTATILFLVQNLFYLGINIYAPSLALSEVAGMDLNAAMTSTGLVCILYTTLGGLKGVLWTDVFQGLIMYAGMAAIIARGSYALGGWENIWNISSNGERLRIPGFETDPRIRYTFWTIYIGGIVNWVSFFGASQSQVQRYLCCKSERKAKIAVYFSGFGIAFLSLCTTACSLVVYAFYHGCDPITQKCIRAPDQILPYMIMDLFRDLRGLPGLFLSTIFSASLSTVSSGVNAMATVIIEDLIKPYTHWKEKNYTRFSKATSALCGFSVLGMAFIASVLGDLISNTLGITGFTLSPLLGVFTLGIWFSFANSKGAVVGLITGIAAGAWVFFGRKSINKPNAFTRQLPLYTDHCSSSCDYLSFKNVTYDIQLYNITHDDIANFTFRPVNDSVLENFYSISYLHFAPMAFGVTIFSGLIASLLTGGWQSRSSVDQRLLRSPFEHWIFSWIPNTIGGTHGSAWNEGRMLKADEVEMEMS